MMMLRAPTPILRRLPAAVAPLARRALSSASGDSSGGRSGGETEDLDAFLAQIKEAVAAEDKERAPYSREARVKAGEELDDFIQSLHAKRETAGEARGETGQLIEELFMGAADGGSGGGSGGRGGRGGGGGRGGDGSGRHGDVARRGGRGGGRGRGRRRHRSAAGSGAADVRTRRRQAVESETTAALGEFESFLSTVGLRSSDVGAMAAVDELSSAAVDDDDLSFAVDLVRRKMAASKGRSHGERSVDELKLLLYRELRSRLHSGKMRVPFAALRPEMQKELTERLEAELAHDGPQLAADDTLHPPSFAADMLRAADAKTTRRPKKFPRRKCSSDSCVCDYGEGKLNFLHRQYLKRFLSPYGRIQPRSETKLCGPGQRRMARAIKTARNMGMLPFTYKQLDDMRRYTLEDLTGGAEETETVVEDAWQSLDGGSSSGGQQQRRA